MELSKDPPIYFPSTTTRQHLSVTKLTNRAGEHHGEAKIITRYKDRWHSISFQDHALNAKRMASALTSQGIRLGDRIGTFMHNSDAHLCAYAAVPSAGFVLHTINIKIQPSHIGYTIRDSQDSAIFVDEDLLDPLFQVSEDNLKSLRFIVIRGIDGAKSRRIGEARTRFPASISIFEFDEFLSSGSPKFRYPPINEWSAHSICYTSGTTGMPKGVVYSHRSTFLCALLISLRDDKAVSCEDTMLINVPMYHALAWCLPIACLSMGSNMIFLSRYFTTENMADAVYKFGVTTTQGVPTVLDRLRTALKDYKGKKKTLCLNRVFTGGSKPAKELIDYYWRELNVEFVNTFGMTELNPVGTISRRIGKNKHLNQSEDQLLSHIQMAGLPAPGMELKIVDPDDFDKEMEKNGEDTGELLIQAPWATGSYLNRGSSEVKNWMKTGDIASIDREGYLQIRDRSKDVIKSGGEWISSIDLENAVLTNFPNRVQIAAIVGQFHPKWQERPVLIIQLRRGCANIVTLKEVKSKLEKEFVKFQLPDDLLVWEEIPLTGTGKIDKKKIRAILKENKYKLPRL